MKNPAAAVNTEPKTDNTNNTAIDKAKTVSSVVARPPTTRAVGSVVQARKSAASKVGIVTSAKMLNTVTVLVENYKKHPLYKKQIKKTTKFKAHDELGSKVGQKVKISETRPISRDVHYKVAQQVK